MQRGTCGIIKIGAESGVEHVCHHSDLRLAGTDIGDGVHQAVEAEELKNE